MAKSAVGEIFSNIHEENVPTHVRRRAMAAIPFGGRYRLIDFHLSNMVNSLRIDRLDEITAVCDRPLVLHGGSGTPDDQMQNAIHHGITKINIYHDVVAAMNRGLKEKINTMQNPTTWPIFVFEDAKKEMKEVIRNKIRTFGSNNRI